MTTQKQYWPGEKARPAVCHSLPGGIRAAGDDLPWDDDDFDPAREPWEPEPLDDDEPEPQRGDFWLEPDAFDE